MFKGNWWLSWDGIKFILFLSGIGVVVILFVIYEPVTIKLVTAEWRCVKSTTEHTVVTINGVMYPQTREVCVEYQKVYKNILSN